MMMMSAVLKTLLSNKTFEYILLSRPGSCIYKPRSRRITDYYQRFFIKCSLQHCAAIMLEITCNDRLGKKVRVKCNEDDTIGDLKKLIAAQTGTRADKIVLKKWYTIFKDHVTLGDYEIHDGQNLELYYQ
ncbi:hypothetical protein RRG08_038817 [Elysia crispata]|nr:hypothetical protein RRG08_038817 [Elysia crispata]